MLYHVLIKYYFKKCHCLNVTKFLTPQARRDKERRFLQIGSKTKRQLKFRTAAGARASARAGPSKTLVYVNDGPS